MNYFEKSAAVVRTYNNKHITKQVGFLLGLGFRFVFVVVDVAQDKGSTTLSGGWLEKYRHDTRLKIIEIHQGYSWSNALNICIEHIFIHNFSSTNEKIDFIFNCSVEAGFIENALKLMFDKFKVSNIGVVGTSFRGILDGNEISLGRSYRHPRNTGMIIRVDVFQNVGRFDQWCDQIGGMEDIDFILRMLSASNWTYEHLDFEVRLIVGQNHNQAIKEGREQDAMDRIILRLRSLFPPETTVRKRIEQAIKKMGLEEE
jgi:hypothetical protein